MGYEQIEDITRADIAFRISGKDINELFVDAAKALLSVMTDTKLSAKSETRIIELSSSDLELLLFDFLNEIIFFKDSKSLFLVPDNIKIIKLKDKCMLKAKLYGETIDIKKHAVNTDVKAVTMHNLSVKQIKQGWQATVVFDV